MLGRLNEVQRTYPCIGDLRGRGLMVGAEIVADRSSKEKAPKKREAILVTCFQRGLVLIGCGENTIRFAPPLVISIDEMREGLDVFEAALNHVETKHLGSA